MGRIKPGMSLSAGVYAETLPWGKLQIQLAIFTRLANIDCSLVYGGSERQQRSNVAVWRVGDVAEMMGMIG